MNHSNPRPNHEQTAHGLRPVCVPRPARPKAGILLPKRIAALPPRLVSQVPIPPPAPTRPSAKPAKASPPPLPETILLTDSDLIDDDAGQAVRASQPPSVDVELDCFTRSEPPPESRPQRKRGLLALVIGLVVVAGSGLLFLGRPIATQAFRSLNTEHSAAARAPAMLSVAALSAPVPPAPVLTSPATAAPKAASSARVRSKLSVPAKRAQAAAVNRKKPVKPVILQRVLPDVT